MEAKKGKRALVITGGECFPEYLDIDPHGYDVVIAADSGLYNARELGIVPGVVIGDFDSFSGVLPEGVTVIRLPAHKDVTDTTAACDYASEKLGCESILVIGGTGGRLDHTIANISYLENMKQRGINATLSDGKNTCRILKDETIEIESFDGFFSVFALDEAIVSESGSEYTLDEAKIIRQVPLGVSNEIRSGKAKISVSGTVVFTTYSEKRKA